MAEVRIVTDVCDLCGAETDVEPQRLALNRRKGKIDACAECKPKIVETVGAFLDAGEPITSRR